MEVSNIPWALIAPLLILQFVLAAVTIIDIVRVHETRGPKWMWVVISLIVNTIGPVLYFIIGRKNS
jgi:hypothetical protein